MVVVGCGDCGELTVTAKYDGCGILCHEFKYHNQIDTILMHANNGSRREERYNHSYKTVTV